MRQSAATDANVQIAQVEMNLIKCITFLQTHINHIQNPRQFPAICLTQTQKAIDYINKIYMWLKNHSHVSPCYLNAVILTNQAINLITCKIGAKYLCHSATLDLIDNLIKRPPADAVATLQLLKQLVTKLKIIPLELFTLTSQELLKPHPQATAQTLIDFKHWLCDIKVTQLIQIQRQTDIKIIAHQLEEYKFLIQDECFKNILAKRRARDPQSIWFNTSHLVITACTEQYHQQRDILYKLLSTCGAKNFAENVFLLLCQYAENITDLEFYEKLQILFSDQPSALQKQLLIWILASHDKIKTADNSKISKLYWFFRQANAFTIANYLSLLYSYNQTAIDRHTIDQIVIFEHLIETYNLISFNKSMATMVEYSLHQALKKSAIEAVTKLLDTAIENKFPKKLTTILITHYIHKYNHLNEAQRLHELSTLAQLNYGKCLITLINKLVRPLKRKKTDEEQANQAEVEPQQKKPRDSGIDTDTDSDGIQTPIHTKKRKQANDEDLIKEDDIETQPSVKHQRLTRASAAQISSWEEYDIENAINTLADRKAPAKVEGQSTKGNITFYTNYRDILQTYDHYRKNLVISHSLLMTKNGYNNPEDPLIFGLFLVNKTEKQLTVKNLILPFWGTLRFVKPSDREVAIAPHIKTLSNPISETARCIEHPKNIQTSAFWKPAGSYQVNHNNRGDNIVIMANIRSEASTELPVDGLPAMLITEMTIPPYTAQEITCPYHERANGANCLSKDILAKHIPDEQLRCPAHDIKSINEKNYLTTPRPTHAEYAGLFGQHPKLWPATNSLKPQTAHKWR